MIKFSHTKAIAVLLAVAGPFLSLLPEPGQATTVEEDMVWTGGLRQAYFGDRPITQSDELIVLEAPIRADDAAIVRLGCGSSIVGGKSRLAMTSRPFAVIASRQFESIVTHWSSSKS